MIFSFQRPAFDSLILSARALEQAAFLNLPARPRLHRLLVGPTGTGKTHLAQAVAGKMKWPSVKINAASWIVLGAREESTWESLEKWASSFDDESPAHSVIVLDELDKVWGLDTWSRNCRAEFFDLMDAICPQQHRTKDLERVLRHSLVIGCGAFQDAFEAGESLGFNPKSKDPANLNDLTKLLPRELLNRFKNEVLILPNLQPADYIGMVETACQAMHSDLSAEFRKHAEPAIESAINDKTAARFIETVLGNMLVAACEEDEKWEVPALTGESIK